MLLLPSREGSRFARSPCADTPTILLATELLPAKKMGSWSSEMGANKHMRRKWVQKEFQCNKTSVATNKPHIVRLLQDRASRGVKGNLEISFESMRVLP